MIELINQISNNGKCARLTNNFNMFMILIGSDGLRFAWDSGPKLIIGVDMV
jgi:hypothetical protein